MYSIKQIKDFLISKNLYDIYKTGYLSAFNNMLKSALSLCNKEQYENFIKEIKKLPQDIWEDFSTIINTKPEFYIEKFGEIIKNKKVILWGASIFIQKIIKEGNFLNNKNILGFVDKNKAMQGTKICGYSVFSPEKIKEIAPEAVLMSVYSKSDLTYQSIKKEMAQICPNIELLENIFT